VTQSNGATASYFATPAGPPANQCTMLAARFS